jgi:hypothetical protein
MDRNAFEPVAIAERRHEFAGLRQQILEGRLAQQPLVARDLHHNLAQAIGEAGNAVFLTLAGHDGFRLVERVEILREGCAGSRQGQMNAADSRPGNAQDTGHILSPSNLPLTRPSALL